MRTPSRVIHRQSILRLFATGISLWSLAIFSQDVTPRLEIPSVVGSTVYNNVRVISVTPQGVKIAHDSGLVVIPTSKLPKEWLATFAPSTTAPPSAPESTAPATSPKPVMSQKIGGVEGGFNPNSLVIIKTDKAVGSGFIVQTENRTYVYTNAHVLCGAPGGFTGKFVGIKTAAGRDIPLPYEIDFSENYDPTAPSGLEDMARFAVDLKPGESAYQLEALDPNAAMNHDVVAYGNSLGGDVVTSLPGTILGVGVDRVEVSCEIMSGNSGGPIVLANTQRVIGISTYMTQGERNIWAKETRFEKARRFAILPNKVTKWRRVNYDNLMTSLTELGNFDRDTLSLAAACYLRPKGNANGFDVPSVQQGDYIVKQVIIDGARLSLGGTISANIARVNQRLGGSNTAISFAVVVPVFQEFFATVAKASKAQVDSLKASDRIPYLKQYISGLVEERGQVHEAFVNLGTQYR